MEGGPLRRNGAWVWPKTPAVPHYRPISRARPGNVTSRGVADLSGRSRGWSLARTPPSTKGGEKLFSYLFLPLPSARAPPPTPAVLRIAIGCGDEEDLEKPRPNGS